MIEEPDSNDQLAESQVIGQPAPIVPDESSSLPADSELARLDEIAHDFLRCGSEGVPNEAIPWPGQQVGRFYVERRVAQGSFGTVYQAFDTLLERRVALKIPKPEVVASADDRERVHREALAAASLNHHAIVRVFDGGTLPDGTPYICMEYCDGESLGQYFALRQHGSTSPLPPHVAAKIIAVVAEGVHHAHDRGIVHRDLKPENVLLEKPPASSTPSAITVDLPPQLRLQPRICDFGLAKLGLPSTSPLAMHQASSIAGTFFYMAPEQIQGSVASSVDIFGLGVMLYYLLTGEYPFTGHDWAQMLAQQQRGPSQLSLQNHHVPPDLRAICLKSLQYAPEHRYASAHELAVDLRRFLAEEFVSARRPTILERSWRYAKRNRLATALFGAISLGLIGTAWGFWNANQSLRDSYRTQGQLALRNGEWDQARQFFRFQRTPSTRATLADWRVGYVLSLLASDRASECLRETRDALKSAGERDKATLQLVEGEALLLMATDPAEAEQQINHAIDTGLLALPDLHYAKALSADKVHDARQELEHCLSIDGRHHRARRRIACLEFLSGDFAAARQHTQLLRTMFPEDWYPDCLDAMMLGLSGEGMFPQAEQQMAKLQAKHGAQRCRILQAEFATLRKFLNLSLGQAEAPENDAIVAHGKALLDLWASVQELDVAEGSLSIGMARPILPCIFKSQRDLVAASQLVSEGKIGDATLAMTRVCEAHPESVSYFFLAMSQIKQIEQGISHSDPNKWPSRETMCRGFAQSARSFQKAAITPSPYELYRFTSLVHILIAYAYYPKNVTLPADIAGDLEQTVIAAIDQLNQRARVTVEQGRPVVIVEMQPESDIGKGWQFTFGWQDYGMAAAKFALALKKPELALSLLEKYRSERPDDPNLLQLAAETHIELQNWQAAAEASHKLLAMDETPEEIRDRASVTLTTANQKLSELLKLNP